MIVEVGLPVLVLISLLGCKREHYIMPGEERCSLPVAVTDREHLALLELLEGMCWRQQCVIVHGKEKNIRTNNI